MAHLLIVEDDELLRDGLAELLSQAGHVTTTASDGQSALDHLATSLFDGVVLDLGLPKVDGLTVLRSLRQQHAAMPVLVLTARDGVDSRVEGLNAGADDYLTKPFNTGELVARLQAMLRRASLPAFAAATVSAGQTTLTTVNAPLGSDAPAMQAGSTLSLDPALPRAWLGSEAIDLTPREWALLDLLVRQRGQVVSREAVLQAWQAQPGEPGAASGPLASNALEVYVHRLRRKLAGSAFGIRNIRGLGYMLDAADA
jgi:two-component system response regulator QseB